MIKILILLVFFVAVFIVMIGKYLSTKPYTGEKSDHFNGRRFKNPSGISARGFGAVFKYIRTRKKDKWSVIKDPYVATEKIPDAPEGEIRYTFINHSTYLLQIGGYAILTDPIFSDYCSPFPLPPLKRHRPPGVPMDLLPDIDLVLLTHNHYDHMDSWSIKQIVQRWNPAFITSLGNKHTLKKMGAKNVSELDWWEELNINDIRITATPTNHFSSRGTFDRNTSLWCGFVLAYAKKKVYFLGDSGYSDIFKEIRKRLGVMDLSLIPIGAYLPRWFMSPIHISPEEAVQVHLDLVSKQSVAMHFGTFALADDNPERAISELAVAKKAKGVSDQEFEVVVEGVVQVLDA